MILGILILSLVGIALVVLGYFLWKKEKINLLHDYHYDKVSEENRKPLCTLSGAGLILMGCSLLTTALLLGITNALWSFIPFGVGFAIGLAFLIFTGKKYNS